MDVINITLEEIIKKYTNKYRPKISCDYCKKEGHIEKYCWRKQRTVKNEEEKGHKIEE